MSTTKDQVDFVIQTFLDTSPGTGQLTPRDMIQKYLSIQAMLWGGVKGDIQVNLLQQTMFAGLIRTFDIPGPNGEDPESA